MWGGQAAQLEETDSPKEIIPNGRFEALGTTREGVNLTVLGQTS